MAGQWPVPGCDAASQRLPGLLGKRGGLKHPKVQEWLADHPRRVFQS